MAIGKEGEWWQQGLRGAEEWAKQVHRKAHQVFEEVTRSDKRGSSMRARDPLVIAPTQDSSKHPDSAPPQPRLGNRLITKEDLGTSTWILLHTLAAQLPENPTRQQKKDVKRLVDCLTRIYPCGECAEHFRGLVRHNPPDVQSGPSFQQWLCVVHNDVNRQLDKPLFNCELAASRWLPLECEEEEHYCELAVGAKK